jgi:hypothetical protein
MGGGSSQPQQVESTNTTTNLPSYAQPYYTQLMNQAQAYTVDNLNYTPYTGQRVAGFDPMQQQAQQSVAGMTQPGQYDMATAIGTQAGLQALQGTPYKAAQFNAQQVQAPNVQTMATSYGSQPLQQYQLGDPGTFGQQQAQQYMSPYMQSAVDVQKQQAIRDAQQGQLAQNLGAARLGTYGGSRELIAATERERNLGTQLANIQATGSQAAYTNAQQQYNADRQAQMQTGQQNLQALLQTQGLQTNTGLQSALANLQSANAAQQLGATTGMQAQTANQQANLQAQQYSDAAQQFAAQNQLAYQGQALQASQDLGTLGGQQAQTDLGIYNAQNQIGGQEQQLSQQQMDTAYADFLRQRDYPIEQLGYYSNLLHGVPVGLSSTSTTYAPPPSMAAQVAGTGLAGLGLYNTFKSGSGGTNG